MGSRTVAFGLVIFTPDLVQTNIASNELLIAGEGITVRVDLDAFIKHVDWPTLSTHYEIWCEEQDRIRKEQFRCKKQTDTPIVSSPLPSLLDSSTDSSGSGE